MPTGRIIRAMGEGAPEGSPRDRGLEGLGKLGCGVCREDRGGPDESLGGFGGQRMCCVFLWVLVTLEHRSFLGPQP